MEVSMKPINFQPNSPYDAICYNNDNIIFSILVHESLMIRKTMTSLSKFKKSTLFDAVLFEFLNNELTSVIDV